MRHIEPSEKSYWLSKLCEANFASLVKLIPGLTAMAESSVASVEGKPSLYLELLEHSRYTLILELGHSFGKGFDVLLEPAVRIRVCLDAKVAEVLSDHARPLVHHALQGHCKGREILDYKWTLNYFLYRWLEHCLSCDYHFGVKHTDRSICENSA